MCIRDRSTSLHFCDIILPDLMYQERMNLVSTVTGGSALGFVFGRPFLLYTSRCV